MSPTANIATARPPCASGYVPRGPFIGHPPPVGYWPLGGGYGANDISPYGNHGTSYGARPIGSPFGGGHFFDGVDDYAGTPITNDDLVGDDGTGTISYWFKPLVPIDEQEKNRIIMSVDGNITTGERSWDFRWGADQENDFLFKSHGDLHANVAVILDDIGEWYLITLSYEENGTIELYVNGEIKESDTIDTFDDIEVPLTLCARDGGGRCEKCSLSEVIIWPWALLPRHVKWLYHHPTGLRQPPSVIGV